MQLGGQLPRPVADAAERAGTQRRQPTGPAAQVIQRPEQVASMRGPP